MYRGSGGVTTVIRYGLSWFSVCREQAKKCESLVCVSCRVADMGKLLLLRFCLPRHSHKPCQPPTIIINKKLLVGQ